MAIQTQALKPGGVAPRGRRIDGPIWVLLAAVASVVIVRAVMITTNIARFDSDEAVTGVMAQRILHGEFPTYFGIQNYNGALEQYLQAPILALLPDTPVTLRLVQIALSVAICVLVYFVGTRMVGSRWGGALAAAMYALGPYYSALKSIRSHGSYDATVVLGLVVVLLALRLKDKDARATWTAASLGLCAGLAIWSGYLSVYMLIPAGLWAIGSARGSFRRLLRWGVGGLAVGLAPVLAFRISHGFNAPSGTGVPPDTSFASRMDLLLSPVTGQFLGVRSGVPAFDRLIPAALVTMLALAVLGAAVWTRRRGLWDLITLRTTRRKPIDLLILAFVITPFIYAASSYTWFAGEPRYLFTLYPFLAIGVAAAVFQARGRMRPAAATLILAVSALLLSATMWSVADRGGEIAAADGGLVYTEDLPGVAQTLKDAGVRSVIADYWVANVLQFYGGDELAVRSTGINHFPSLAARAARDPEAAIVSVTGAGADALRATLRHARRTFVEIPSGRFTIFSGITPPWQPGS